MTQAWLQVLRVKERVRSDSLGHGAPFALHGFERHDQQIGHVDEEVKKGDSANSQCQPAG